MSTSQKSTGLGADKMNDVVSCEECNREFKREDRECFYYGNLDEWLCDDCLGKKYPDYEG